MEQIHSQEMSSNIYSMLNDKVPIVTFLNMYCKNALKYFSKDEMMGQSASDSTTYCPEVGCGDSCEMVRIFFLDSTCPSVCCFTGSLKSL